MEKEVKTASQKILEDDILRYKKNKKAQMFALLGLVFNCLYFMLLYAMPKSEFRTITIGFSVVLTLIILLAIFLGSEGVKGYNKNYSILLLVIAAFQVLRIFGYPMQGINDNLFIDADATHTIGYFGIYPGDDSTLFFMILLVYLIASAACLVAAAVFGWVYAVKLENFQKKLDSGAISIEAALKEREAEIERKEAEAPVENQPVEAEKVEETEQPAEEQVEAEAPAADSKEVH